MLKKFIFFILIMPLTIILYCAYYAFFILAGVLIFYLLKFNYIFGALAGFACAVIFELLFDGVHDTKKVIKKLQISNKLKN